MPKGATYKARYNRYLLFWLSATRLPLLTWIPTSRNRFAEGEGFEPPDPLRDLRFSRPTQSTNSANPPNTRDVLFFLISCRNKVKICCMSLL